MTSSPPGAGDGAAPDDHPLPADDDLEIDPPRRRRDLAATYAAVELAPLALAPDGGPMPSATLPLAIPPATPEVFVCLRGPCRFYWQIATVIDHGNLGVFGADGLRDPVTGATYAEPRQLHRTCLAAPGIETDLTEATVVECDRWEPRDPIDVREVELRRRRYYESITTTTTTNGRKPQ